MIADDFNAISDRLRELHGKRPAERKREGWWFVKLPDDGSVRPALVRGGGYLVTMELADDGSVRFGSFESDAVGWIAPVEMPEG